MQDNSKKWKTLRCLLFVVETFYRGSNKCLLLDVQCEGPSEVGYILLRATSKHGWMMGMSMCMSTEFSFIYLYYYGIVGLHSTLIPFSIIPTHVNILVTVVKFGCFCFPFLQG